MPDLIEYSTWSLSDKIALASFFVAFISAIISVCSLIYAGKSLRISKQQHLERYGVVGIYLIDVYKWNKDDFSYISFALNFVNDCTIQNTISKLHLQLDCYDKNKAKYVIKLPPSPSISPVDLRNYSSLLEEPICLQEKSARSGWITFKLPDIIKKDLFVELYTIIATTTDGKTSTVDTHIINKV
jgi:hypothetical protein